MKIMPFGKCKFIYFHVILFLFCNSLNVMLHNSFSFPPLSTMLTQQNCQLIGNKKHTHWVTLWLELIAQRSRYRPDFGCRLNFPHCVNKSAHIELIAQLHVLRVHSDIFGKARGSSERQTSHSHKIKKKRYLLANADVIDWHFGRFLRLEEFQEI